ncbi:helix-turn-helix domain-containing protein [Spirosoma validum]|uniref:Helix-turn-helix transcriptional regulator n=1 Tax=Spirosoma validum TaxID=2771355 RepID=A0A927B035_9BACT|nr:AraC family transcriptional regulator [Spirosoma validum]MBD2752926.1 helix-turn-helix transcriptional regulator [Spirosoma validum]
MTYYHQQFLKIREEVYPNEYVCRQIIQAKRFIDSQFATSIRLSDIAEAAFLSKFHFIRLFKQNYGQTPYQYLTMVRIAQAKRLLRTEKTIREVCFAVGFDSVSSFTALFKKITGVTPSTFRKRLAT